MPRPRQDVSTRPARSSTCFSQATAITSTRRPDWRSLSRSCRRAWSQEWSGLRVDMPGSMQAKMARSCSTAAPDHEGCQWASKMSGFWASQVSGAERCPPEGAERPEWGSGPGARRLVLSVDLPRPQPRSVAFPPGMDGSGATPRGGVNRAPLCAPVNLVSCRTSGEKGGCSPHFLPYCALPSPSVRTGTRRAQPRRFICFFSIEEAFCRPHPLAVRRPSP